MASQFQAVDHSSAWRSSTRAPSTFTFELQSRHLAAFDAAIESVNAQREPLESLSREFFPFADIADDLAHWINQVMHEEGLIILSGFPVDRYSKDDMAILHWGIGTHFGTAMSQSVMGDKLGHVINVGGKDPKERAYRNSMELGMHTDSCDVVAMMCLQKAMQGGVSGYVSAITIYNEILNRRPDLMPILMEGFYYHRFGEEAPGESPVTEEKLPIFSFKDGYLSVNFLRAYIELAAEELNTPLTEDELAALDLVDEIAHDDAFALKFVTQPGQAVFFNNLTVLHNRTGFEDSDIPEEKRHFLRLWLVAHDPRPVSDAWRIYEGRGIEKQEGRTTGFDRADELNYSEFGHKT
ncbi:MAG: TauD/TfdA family dioxygenase [Pseudomonadota bacterium]